MAHYLSIHRHQHGTDVRVFKTPDDYQPDEVFSNLSEERAIEFAKVLGIDFEPNLDEELSIEFINLDAVTEYEAEEFDADPDSEGD